MNTLVAFFEYQKTKYYIYLLNNKRILFLKSNKYNKFTSNLTKKETKILTKIYNSLHIDQNKSTYIKDITVNNNIYNLYFDSNNHNYFWLPTNNKYNELDNNYLNFNYNHQPEIIYSETQNDNNSKKSKFYTKFIKIGSKLLPILVSAALSLTLLTNSTIVKPDIIEQPEQSISETIQLETSPLETIAFEDTEIEQPEIEYNYEEIQEAINNNQNIGQSEKEFLSKLKFIFDENHQYMDLEIVKARLQTLEIKYGVNLHSANASYNLIENEICIEAETFDSTHKATFLHEFLHSLQSSGNPLIGEISTEFFTQETMIRLYKEGILEKEFFLSQYAKSEVEKGRLQLNDESDWIKYLTNNSRFTSGYSGYLNLYHILAEILPEETLRNYQFNPDKIEIISNALSQIDNTQTDKETRAYQLVDSINTLRMYSSERNSYVYSKDLSNCLQYLNYYYYQVNHKTIEQDLSNSLLLELENKFANNLNLNALQYIDNINSISDLGRVLPKTKLSNAQENSIFVYYNADGKFEMIELNNQLQQDYTINQSIKNNSR